MFVGAHLDSFSSMYNVKNFISAKKQFTMKSVSAHTLLCITYVSGSQPGRERERERERETGEDNDGIKACQQVSWWSSDGSTS